MTKWDLFLEIRVLQHRKLISVIYTSNRMKGKNPYSVEITPRSKMSGDGMNELMRREMKELLGETFALYPWLLLRCEFVYKMLEILSCGAFLNAFSCS